MNSQSSSSSGDYIAIVSYEVLKRLHLPVYYYYVLCFIENLQLVYLLTYELQHLFYDGSLGDDGYLTDTSKSIYLRDIVHDWLTLSNKTFLLILIAAIYVAIVLSLAIAAIIIAYNDQLLRRQATSRAAIILRTVLEGYFRVIGQVLVLIATVLIVPSMIVQEEVERCVAVGDSDLNPKGVQAYYTCTTGSHPAAIAAVAIGGLAGIGLTLFSILFINLQFPSNGPRSLPQSVWDPRPRAYLLLWKLNYVFHYDIFGSTYRLAFRAVGFYFFYNIVIEKLYQPSVYDRVVHGIEYFFYALLFFLQCVIVLQDFGLLDPFSLAREFLPIVALLAFLGFGIILSIERNHQTEALARDNRDPEAFDSETEMELYVNILLKNLTKLVRGGRLNQGAEQYSSSPDIFTIISRHMEDCKNEECVCRKYEPEFDKKFSSRGMSTRKLTRRQSSMSFSFGGPTRLDSSYFRKKAPVKISYDSKCAIFMAELADCLDRFSQSPKCRSTGAGVGIKLQKSYFYHEHMQSSYKALFVQLENSLQCKTFLGKVHIYHLKTLIQEEMIHSESSPLASLDITSCLKFEAHRLVFEQRITDLCLACEQFWTELISRGEAPVTKPQEEEEKKKEDSQEDEEEEEEDDSLMDAQEIPDDYNVEKVSSTLLEIASTIIDIKRLFAELCQLNGQSVSVLQSYALVYRFILRDEYRFEELVSSLNQLHRTNKLEHTRDNTPAFFDSDDYVLAQVSGDLKDLGRVVRVSRGIDQILGFTPDEVKGSKIEKLMPALYAQVHEDFMHGFLRRGNSSFIDKNQFLLAQNKLGFLTVILIYVKALVDLRQGLMFVAFIKSPIKVPLTYDTKDGQCTAQTGAVFEKTKDAHFLLCDGKGFIHGMSQNCMKNLGLPPTLVFKQNGAAPASTGMVRQASASNVEQEETGFGGNQLVNINRFAQNILGPEYEFDLVRGMNFVFDSSALKNEKSLAKEFAEIKNRMCRYNISVSMRRTEYRLRSKDFKLSHEILLFTIVINSYSFTDTPNIIIPVFRDEDEQFASGGPAPVTHQVQDEMRTSKFKEFKARVQELQMPSKVARLQRITFGFFFFLIGVFSLNYAICVRSNKNFASFVQVRDIVFQLMDKVPSTARFVRSAINVANGFEYSTDEVLVPPQEDRFTYYMRRVAENADSFASLQQLIYTQYQTQLQFDQSGPILQLSDLQTDFSVKTINQTLSGALNLYLSKALKVNQYSLKTLAGVTVPYMDWRAWNTTRGASQIQIDLYFILKNGNEVIPKALQSLGVWTEQQVEQQSQTFSLVSIIIAVSSVLAITVIVVPLTYPLLTHFEVLAEIILHAFNKLSPSFVEHEVECCNQLYGQINHKSSEERLAREEAEKETMMRQESVPHHESVSRVKKRSVQRSDKQQYAQEEGGGNMLQLLRNNIQAGMGGEAGFKKPRLLMKALIQPVNKIFAPSEIIHLGEEDSENTTVFRKYERRGHMPAVVRRRSYYERMKETFERLQEEDSFREDGTESNNSSQSNYTHQDYHTQQIQAIKQLGLLDPEAEEVSGQMQLDITQAKTSDIPREGDEDKDLKRLARSRQNRIKQAMQKSRCTKLVSISLLVIAISVYLAVNTIYTYMVFNYERDLRGNMQVIDQRVLCYPFSLDVLKEMLARQAQVPVILQGFGSDGINGTRAQIVRCYKQEQDFSDLVLGTSSLSSHLTSVTAQYMEIQGSLSAGNVCPTLIAAQTDQVNDYVTPFCATVQNGIMAMGLHEALSFMLSQEEKIALDFDDPRRQAIPLMLNSSLNEQEMFADIFLVPALDYQRASLINVIQSFANYLFGVFDILFGVFVAALCLATGFIGFVYIRKNLQRRIVQIYHVVMLIPHGDRTKRELNELIKLEM